MLVVRPPVVIDVDTLNVRILSIWVWVVVGEHQLIAYAVNWGEDVVVGPVGLDAVSIKTRLTSVPVCPGTPSSPSIIGSMNFKSTLFGCDSTR